MPPNQTQGQMSWGYMPAGERPHAGGSGSGSKPLPPGTPSPEPPGLAGTSLVCGAGCHQGCHRCHQHRVTRSGPAHPGWEPSPGHAPTGTINHCGCGIEGGGSASVTQRARGPAWWLRLVTRPPMHPTDGAAKLPHTLKPRELAPMGTPHSPQNPPLAHQPGRDWGDPSQRRWRFYGVSFLNWERFVSADPSG